eukprot:scaffold1237_cov243-Pinguiococcus_pyrenoidosus.AAC.44
MAHGGKPQDPAAILALRAAVPTPLQPREAKRGTQPTQTATPLNVTSIISALTIAAVPRRTTIATATATAVTTATATAIT